MKVTQKKYNEILETLKVCCICEKKISDNEIGYQDEITIICNNCYNSDATDGKE